MCGIIGIKFFSETPEKSSQDVVRRGLRLQSHRGPDFEDVLSIGRTVLGHNRLAIIDLNPRSNQPFTDEYNRYSIVFNGEIYNYPELKNELLAKGYNFRTSSDTEVLLYHLMEHGASGISRLNGCFAFAFYDKLEDELILARDHMGVNPLLFAIQDDRLLFASELAPFFEMMDAHEIDHDALNELFKFTYIAAPRTILKGVQKLLPGHYVKVKGKYLDVVKYWSKLPNESFEGSRKEVVQEGRRLIENAVIKRMEADVPLGCFLSGGIDSSIVAAIAAQFKEGIATFSVGFNDESFFDESIYAQEVADHIGTIHHPISLSQDEVIPRLIDVIDSLDEPFADSSAIAMYFLSEGAKKKLTVCLSGDGADELLAGYNKHYAFLKAQHPNVLLKWISNLAVHSKRRGRGSKVDNKLRQLAKFGELHQLNWPDNYWFLASFISDEERSSLLIEPREIDRQITYKTSTLSNFLLMDQDFVLQGDMLKKVDVMSMRHSLEVRTPFLDKELVQFVNGLDDSFKRKDGLGKLLLREAFANDLPPSVFKRSKKGFEVPLDTWLRKGWGDLVNEEWFEADFIESQGLFNVTAINSLKEKFFSNRPEESATTLWTFIVFQNWYVKWMVKK